MAKDILIRIREKLEESPTKEAIKLFLKHIIAWELDNFEKESPKYREPYENLIKKSIERDKAREK